MSLTAIADLVWPTLEGEPKDHERREHEKLAAETKLITEAASSLGSNEAQLRVHLGVSENLLESERSRKAGVEARLLSMAGLVSIAGTVVLGALFSLATEKLTFGAPLARTVLSAGCLYLALQLVAALRASVKGLQATGYFEDQPHELLPSKGVKQSVYLRHRIQQILVRVAEHRQINNGKLDQLKIAHVALRNFLWGLLGVALAAFVVAVAWPPQNSQLPPGPSLSVGPMPLKAELEGTDLKEPVLLIATGICLLALGGTLLTFSRASLRRIAGATMAACGVGLTLFGTGKLDATLFKIDKVIGELRFDLSADTRGKTHQAFIRRIVTVGPFPDGGHLLAEADVIKCVSSALDQYDEKLIGGWEVVGRVDKRQLRSDVAKVYGSNQTLAMMRAKWVTQKVMTSKSSFDLTHAIVSVGGAREGGISVGPDDLQSDRVVDVFAVVNASISDRGMADLPKPVVCPSPKSSL